MARLLSTHRTLSTETNIPRLPRTSAKTVLQSLWAASHSEANAWQLHGIHGPCMATAWQLHGLCMATAWQLHGNCMARTSCICAVAAVAMPNTAWQLHGNCMATSWQLHGNCMATAWPMHGNCMASAWQLVFVLKPMVLRRPVLSHNLCSSSNQWF